jgi:acetyl-CoA synthetase
MPADIFKKTPKYFRLSPNLPDYEKARQDFSYEDLAKKELEFFSDGKLNAAYIAVDKHLATPAKDKIALIWEGAQGERKTYTYNDLSHLSNRFGNFFKKKGVARGDRVFIFLPRVPDLYIAFLGILKIGAIAGTLFSAFGEQALLDRLLDSGAKVLVTNRELSKRLINIRDKLPNLQHILINDDPSFADQLLKESDSLEIEHMEKDDYAFMLYTSGTTGKPKGVVHRH